MFNKPYWIIQAHETRDGGFNIEIEFATPQAGAFVPLSFPDAGIQLVGSSTIISAAPTIPEGSGTVAYRKATFKTSGSVLIDALYTKNFTAFTREG